MNSRFPPYPNSAMPTYPLHTLHLAITGRLKRPPQQLDRIRRHQTNRRNNGKLPPKRHTADKL
jgi:hypothetical protein